LAYAYRDTSDQYADTKYLETLGRVGYSSKQILAHDTKKKELANAN